MRGNAWKNGGYGRRTLSSRYGWARETSPTLTYDREANALYVRFSREAIAETVELSETVYVDLDRAGEPVGFEILHAAGSHLEEIPSSPDTAALRDLLEPNTA